MAFFSFLGGDPASRVLTAQGRLNPGDGAALIEALDHFTGPGGGFTLDLRAGVPELHPEALQALREGCEHVSRTSDRATLIVFAPTPLVEELRSQGADEVPCLELIAKDD
jgi:hypothetical protein